MHSFIHSFIGALAYTGAVSKAESSQLAVARAASPAVHRWPGCNYRRIQKRQKEEPRKKSGLLALCVCVICVVTPVRCASACIMCAIEIKGQKKRKEACSSFELLHLVPLPPTLHLSFPSCSHASFPIYSSLLSLCNCRCICSELSLT